MSYAYLHECTGERLIVAEDGESDTSDDKYVGITCDPARACLFDAGTGRRL